MIYLHNFAEHVAGIEAGDEVATIGNTSWFRMSGRDWKIDYDNEHKAVTFQEVGTANEFAPDTATEELTLQSISCS